MTGNEWERRDLISNRRIEQWNAEGWRTQTGEEATARAGFAPKVPLQHNSLG